METSISGWTVYIYIWEELALKYDARDSPVPNLGETIWVEGQFKDNGYTVKHKHIEYDKLEIHIYAE